MAAAAASETDNEASAALQSAAAALPRPPPSPRRKQRPSRGSSQQLPRGEIDLLTGGDSGDDGDDEGDYSPLHPTPVVSAGRSAAIRNFSVPDPTELQKWKAEMRASHVRNEHYDSPPISPRTYHETPQKNDVIAHVPSHEASKKCGCSDRHRKSHSKKHSRKSSAPVGSSLTSEAKEDGVTKSPDRQPSRHQRSKSESVDVKSADKAHMWEPRYTTASRPGVSRSNSVSHSVHTNRTVFDSEREALRENNIHMVRARQQYGDGAQSFSFSARALPLVDPPSSSNETNQRENARSSLRADSMRSNMHACYQQVALSAPKYCQDGAREKARSVTDVGSRKVVIDALPFMKCGTRMFKKGRNGRRQVRWLFLSKDQTAIFWNGGLLSTSRVFIRLKDIEAVIPQTNWSQHGCSFALKFPEKNSYNRTVLHLMVFRQHDVQVWVGGLTRLVDYAKKGYDLGEVTDVQIPIETRIERPCTMEPHAQRPAPSQGMRKIPLQVPNTEPNPSKMKITSNASAKPAKFQYGAENAVSHSSSSRKRPSLQRKGKGGHHGHVALLNIDCD